MSFLIKNKTGADIEINDLGLTIPAGGGSPDSGIFDLAFEDPRHVADSDDLVAQVQAGDIVVLDPLDGTTELSTATAVEVIRVHNDPHYRIRGGRIFDIDDVSGSTVGLTNEVLQWNGSNAFTASTPGSIVDDATDNVKDIIESVLTAGTDINFTTGSPLTITVNVDDSFLRNDGDTLDSGTLNIASGATLDVNSGGTLSVSSTGSLAIAAGATATLIGGPETFNNSNQIVNKGYIDSVAAGFDPKESVHAATTTNLESETGVSWTPLSGSPQGDGSTLTAASAGTTTIDGVLLADGDRVLIKNGLAGSPQQNEWNGIYVASNTGAGSATVLTRAEDSNNNPNSEVSGGNFTFVEEGTTNADTGWVISSPSGVVDLDNEAIIWTQFSGAGAITAEVGIAQVGSTLALDLSSGELTAATPALTDRIAFHDVDGSAQGTAGSQTYGATFSSTFDALDVVYGIDANGIIVRTADDTYASRTITAETTHVPATTGSPEVTDWTGLEGISVAYGDGISGDPQVGLDINGLTATTTMDATDELVLYDSATGSNLKITGSDLSDSVISNILSYGQVGGDTGLATAHAHNSRIDLVDATNGGIVTVASEGTGSPLVDQVTFALDISDLATGDTANLDNTDTIAVYDGADTVQYTFQEVFDTLDFPTDAWTTINGDSGTITADNANDTLELIGGNGIITTASTGGSPEGSGSPEVDTVRFEFSIPDLVDGVDSITTSDSWAIYDGTQTAEYGIGDTLDDLGVPYGIDDTGIVTHVSGSPVTYEVRILEEYGAGIYDGILVTDGDGINGNPTVGLDITGTPAKGEDMESTDEFIVHDPTGSPQANKKITGQEVADGVLTASGLSIQQIGGSGSPGQTTLFLTDDTRGKDLSTNEFVVTFSEARITKNDWLNVGLARDASTGHLMPMNATLVRVSATAASGGPRDIDLYIDGSAVSTPLFTIPGGSGVEYSDITLDIDVDAAEKIRLREGGSGGITKDVVVNLWFKWRT